MTSPNSAGFDAGWTPEFMEMMVVCPGQKSGAAGIVSSPRA
jgi:hypothetical protein